MPDSFAEYHRLYGDRKRCRPQTPHLDLLEMVMGADRMTSYNARRDSAGEFDAFAQFSRRSLRILQGAGWLRLGGLAPDQVGHLVSLYGPQEAQANPTDWYLRTALRAVQERRLLARWSRERRFLAARGHSTYFEHRNAESFRKGYPSLWHERKARGWG